MVTHAGIVAIRLFAAGTGLTGELSKAAARGSFRPVDDRGTVLVDVAVLHAHGGEAIADIDVLRHHLEVPPRPGPGSRRVRRCGGLCTNLTRPRIAYTARKGLSRRRPSGERIP